MTCCSEPPPSPEDGYAEFFSAVSAESDANWFGTADFGLNHGLTDHIQLDAGVAVGVTADVAPFRGLAIRF